MNGVQNGVGIQGVWGTSHHWKQLWWQIIFSLPQQCFTVLRILAPSAALGGQVILGGIIKWQWEEEYGAVTASP